MAEEDNKKNDAPFDPSTLRCPKCGSTMHLVKGRYGTFYACDNFKVNGCKGAAHDPTRDHWTKKKSDTTKTNKDEGK